MERHGHLDLDPGVRQRLLAASAATLDRLLQPIRTPAARGSDAGGSRWAAIFRCDLRRLACAPPGFLEIDLVVHHGGSLWGSMIHSLVATDICTGWTEAGAAAGPGAVPGGGRTGGHRATVALPSQRHRLGQRQHIHQRNSPPVLRRAGHRVHPFPAVPQERPSLD